MGYVDDTVAIIVAPDLNTAQLKTEIMMRKFARWMGEAWTPTSSRKDKNRDTVCETNRNNCADTDRQSSYRIETLRRVLGVTIDTKLTFAEYLREATEKASIRVS